MRAENLRSYFVNALHESIYALGNDVEEIIRYYGDKTECTLEGYFSAQIHNDCIHDTTDNFDPENFVCEVNDDNKAIFNAARNIAFRDWAIEKMAEEVEEYADGAYISRKEVEKYAERTKQDFRGAFNDLEQEMSAYIFVEEANGRIIFHEAE